MTDRGRRSPIDQISKPRNPDRTQLCNISLPCSQPALTGQLTHNWLVVVHPLRRDLDFNLDPVVAPTDTNSLAFAQRCSLSRLDGILSDLEPDLVPGRSCPLREPDMGFRVGARSIQHSAKVVAWIRSPEEELQPL
jgi:hypothetical protein